LGCQIGVVEIRTIAELQHAFQMVSENRPDAIINLSSPIFGTNPTMLAKALQGARPADRTYGI
jgi:hypothetical protein